MAKNARYVFSVSEFADQSVWIRAEPRDEQIASLENGLTGFILKEGTTFEEAKEFASLLREVIAKVILKDAADK
jgi:hypothetical protein